MFKINVSGPHVCSSWVVLKATDGCVSQWYFISLDAGLRPDGILAMGLWDIVFSMFLNNKHRAT